MTFSLYVDEERWRRHLREVVSSTPGIVPVVKGNGYGVGNARLAAEAALLGVDTVAVGTSDELPAVARGVPGRRAGAHAVVPARRPGRDRTGACRRWRTSRRCVRAAAPGSWSRR